MCKYSRGSVQQGLGLETKYRARKQSSWQGRQAAEEAGADEHEQFERHHLLQLDGPPKVLPILSKYDVPLLVHNQIWQQDWEIQKYIVIWLVLIFSYMFLFTNEIQYIFCILAIS